MKKEKRAIRAVTARLLALGIGMSARTTHAAERRVNVVAFGDSVMWGQGLAERDKFRSIVRDHIHMFTPGRDVQLFNHSRSGAKIQPLATGGNNTLSALPQMDPPGAPIMSDDPAKIWGAVPWQLPSITKQSATPVLAYRRHGRRPGAAQTIRIASPRFTNRRYTNVRSGLAREWLCCVHGTSTSSLRDPRRLR